MGTHEERTVISNIGLASFAQISGLKSGRLSSAKVADDSDIQHIIA